MRSSGLSMGHRRCVGGMSEGWLGGTQELDSPWSAPAANTLGWCTQCQTLTLSQGSVCLCHPLPQASPPSIVSPGQGPSVTLGDSVQGGRDPV